ncbi:MAG: serine/threonine protein kinase [Acidobacteria bacterium]|nr:serine/threonine protein kinase [Acidobacteriota bacterium]
MVGRTIAHYEVLEKLGAGGMGEVFKARDRKLNRFVALKVLPHDQMADPERRRRFLQEAQAASALNHPNIIVIHDVVADDQGDCLVMEYVAGRTLADLVPKTGLSSSQVLRYGIQIADALAAAHHAGILHRDLKPGNVMINDHGLAKLLDFGLAKIMEPAVSSDLTATQTLDSSPKTAAGTILGTASYMSPEQVEGKTLDARSDIFSFGLVLYEMITGRRAFQGDSAITTLTAVLRDQPPRIAELAADAPPQLERLVNRCLEKDPAERWQTMKDLHAAMQGLKEDLDSGSIIASRRHAAVAAAALPKKKTARFLIGAAAGLVVVVVAAGALWLKTRPAPAPPPQQQTAAQPGPAPEPAPAPVEPASTPPKELQPAAARPAPAKAAPPKAAAPKVIITGQAETTPPQSQPIAPATPAPPPPVLAAPQTVAVPVSIPDGTRIRLVATSDVPAGAGKGDVVHLAAAAELRIGDAVVVAKGASATAVLGEAGRKFIFGKKNKVPVMLDTIAAADGSRLHLRGTVQSQSKGKPVELNPPDAKDSPVALPKGTEFDAFVDGGADVKVLKKRP